MFKTSFLHGQGLGNQLWAYAACRGIAKYHNVPFLITGTQNFKGRSFLNIDLAADEFIPDHEHRDLTNSFRSFQEALYYDPELSYFASSYDSRVEHIDYNVNLCGLFQSEKYLYGNISDLRSWISLHPTFLAEINPFRETCVLNLRGGEYKRHKNLILPKSYWLNAIKNIKRCIGVDKFIIVTDDPRYASAFLPGIPVLRGGIAECYSALHCAAAIVVSNSSFSYFPIKTRSDQPFVIAPMYWSRFANKYCRWASPSNIYTNWLWQDFQGNLSSYETCILNASLTDLYYLEQCTVLSPASAFTPSPRFPFLTSAQRRLAKHILSIFFPRLIG